MVTASNQVDDPILQSVRQDIASMKTRGAGEIGKQAALALARAAEKFPGSDLQEFQARVIAAAKLIASARPTAVSLRNGLNYVIGAAHEAKDVAGAKAHLKEHAEEFANIVDEAKQKIARLGAEQIGPNETIFTHCHSTAALGVLIEAQKQGKHPKVFATETRPFRQGLITTKALQEAGVDVTLVVDSAALHVMDTMRISRVVIGSDAVAADGSLYNKIGTRLVTLAAKSLKIPVLCCAEAYKFSPYTLEGEEVEIEERDPAEIVSAKELPGVKVLNPVFDRTPPDQISVYVTDFGLVKPKDVAGVIKKNFGGQARWI